MVHTEHAFASYIRILGKGKRGTRSLTREEAYRAMQMILQDRVEPEQLGAFLMLIRIKEETAAELAGFVQAVQEVIKQTVPRLQVDLDWSSYAGKRRHLPWFILTAVLLAENNIRIVMHGARGHTQGRLYSQDIFETLGMNIATSFKQAEQQLQDRNFSFLPLQYFCSVLAKIIDLRPLLGLRSPVHTLARMLNPFNAEYSIQGIFHPSYQPVHQQASLLLDQAHVAILKGEGGEVERNPDAPCLVQSLDKGRLSNQEWSALFKKRHLKPKQRDPEQLKALWHGSFTDDYAQAAVIGTAAIALKLLGKAEDQQTAEHLAQDYWDSRDRNRFK